MTIVLAIRLLLIIGIGAFLSDGVAYVFDAPYGKPFVIKDPYYDQLNGGFMRIATLVLGLPMWAIFLTVRIRDRISAAE